MLIIRLMMLFDIPLAMAHEASPGTKVLPLGGSEIAQLGILLCTAYVITELHRIYKDWRDQDRR